MGLPYRSSLTFRKIHIMIFPYIEGFIKSFEIRKRSIGSIHRRRMGIGKHHVSNVIFSVFRSPYYAPRHKKSLFRGKILYQRGFSPQFLIMVH